MSKAVVMIPGYYGSELVDRLTGFEFWITEWAINHPHHVLEAIRLDTGDPKRIHARDPLDHFTLLGFIHIGIYHALADFLRNDVGYPPSMIFPAGIDFRQSLTDLADDLHARISAIQSDQIDLVAHSHGGLVARAYLQKHPDPRVKSLTTFGTPHKGMLKTFKAIYDGISFATFPADHLRRVARSLPSAYEILPFDATDDIFRWNGTAADPNVQNDWCETQTMKDMLAKAANVIANLDTELPVDGCFIYGTHLSTTSLCDGNPTGLQFFDDDGSGLGKHPTLGGDSTVPLQSARGDNVTSKGELRRYPIPFGVHGSLFANPYGQEILRGVLTGAPPKRWCAVGWSQDPAYIINSVNRLVVEVRDDAGNVIPNARVTLTLNNDAGHDVPQTDPLGDYQLAVTMPGQGSVLHWKVKAGIPNEPSLTRQGTIFALNN